MLAKYTSINKNCMTQIRQNTVLITGGASGIDKLMGSKSLQRETIAEAILQAVEQNKILLRKPFIVNLLPFLRGILPTRVFDKVAGQWFVHERFHRPTGCRCKAGQRDLTQT